MRSKDRQKAVVEVTRRVYEQVLSQAKPGRQTLLDDLIHEVLYYERQRLEAHPDAVNAHQDRIWIDELRSRFRKASQLEKKRLIEEIASRYTGEVVGSFSEPLYRLSTAFLPFALGVMLNGISPLKLARRFPGLPDLSDNIVIEGDLEHIRLLQRIGTIIFVPTHSSNLDSVAIGYSFFRASLPPVTYGAGINLFTHRLFGFFMNRLGAYKVDRLKRSSLYKEVLKEYATVTLELGYHNLFFPGGTRSRSGAIEKKLKLGLLGCGIRAYYNNLKRRAARPGIFVVPCTINYQLVLEAETLMEDHLKEAGKSRYIIMDDEFSMPGRIYAFLKNLATLDAAVHIRFSRPLDLFGNFVDRNGHSMDGRGRPIDTRLYLCGADSSDLVSDPQRDEEYTREVGKSVVTSFTRDSMVFSTHVLAWTAFECIRRQAGDTDFFRFLRETAYETSIPMVEFYKDVESTLEKVAALSSEEKIRMGPTLKDGNAEDVVEQGLRLFGTYHKRPVLERRGDRLFPMDVNLLYYYRNRLWGYGLDGSS